MGVPTHGRPAGAVAACRPHERRATGGGEMMRTARRAAIAATTAGAIAIGVPTSASADIDALPNVDSQFRKGATALARAIAENPRHVRRASFAMLPPGGRPAAISTTRLAGFPRHGKSFGILSTGDARYAGRR